MSGPVILIFNRAFKQPQVIEHALQRLRWNLGQLIKTLHGRFGGVTGKLHSLIGLMGGIRHAHGIGKKRLIPMDNENCGRLLSTSTVS